MNNDFFRCFLVLQVGWKLAYTGRLFLKIQFFQKCEYLCRLLQSIAMAFSIE